MKKSLLVFLSVIVIVIFFGPAKLKANSDGFEKVYCEATIEDEFIDNQILVVVGKEKSLNYYDFKNSDFINIGCINIEDLTASRKEEVLARVNEEENNINLDTFRRILLLTLNKNDKKNVLDCIKKLEKREDIYSAEPNFLFYQSYENENLVLNASGNSQRTVNSDFYYQIDDDGGIGQWSINKINLQSTWNEEDSIDDLATTYVGVIDYGIKCKENVNGGCEPELIGKVDQFLSKDFIDNYDDYEPDSLTEYTYHSHGTFVAGILAARSDDNYGVRGVSKNIKLVSLKIDYGYSDYNEEYNCYQGKAQMIRAINYAQNINIKILNISLGYGVYCTSELVAMQNYDGLIICAAGNECENLDENPMYPAAYNCDNMITVGASTLNDAMWKDSNFSSTHVDLYAPGEGIISIGNFGNSIQVEGYEGYRIGSGTSFAAPYVTGVAAMIWSRYPLLEYGEVKQRILSNVDRVEALNGKCITSGRLNAYKAYINDHIHNYNFTPFDSNYHSCSCAGCYFTYYQEHEWVPYLRMPIVSPMVLICNKCGERKIGK